MDINTLEEIVRGAAAEGIERQLDKFAKDIRDMWNRVCIEDFEAAILETKHIITEIEQRITIFKDLRKKRR